jgi:hypothetical protein
MPTIIHQGAFADSLSRGSSHTTSRTRGGSTNGDVGRGKLHGGGPNLVNVDLALAAFSQILRSTTSPYISGCSARYSNSQSSARQNSLTAWTTP